MKCLRRQKYLRENIDKDTKNLLHNHADLSCRSFSILQSKMGEDEALRLLNEEEQLGKDVSIMFRLI